MPRAVVEQSSLAGSSAAVAGSTRKSRTRTEPNSSSSATKVASTLSKHMSFHSRDMTPPLRRVWSGWHILARDTPSATPATAVSYLPASTQSMYLSISSGL